jgi:predicted AlkP superfamily pyrophosphatase or phosphodiesterase
MRPAFFWLFAFMLLACQAQPIVQSPLLPNSAEARRKPYVILVSIDGFRDDYIELHGAVNLARIAEGGVRARSMTPSFPSLTFPNHYTLVTGMRPESHGLVSNGFYDPARKESYRMGDRSKVEDGYYYGGTPIWNLAEQQGLRAACFFWVGSEAPVGGIRPSWYYVYNSRVPDADRIKQAAEWLALPDSIRPHLITLYFSEVDHEGHVHGPESPETRAAVQEVDSLLGVLDQQIQASGLPVNLVVVSDHGMQQVDQAHPIPGPEIDWSGLEVSRAGTMWMVYGTDSARLETAYQALKAQEDRFRVYRKAEVPAHLHFRNHSRIGDLVLIADAPGLFQWGLPPRPLDPGAHGYDPTVTPSMGALFVAKGPQVKGKGKMIPAFGNIHVYPYVAGMLDLELPAGIDGDSAVLRPWLKRR